MPEAWGAGVGVAIKFSTGVAVGVTVLRWLLPHTPKEFKAPVLAYVFVILAMCIAAAGFAFGSQRWAVLGGAFTWATGSPRM